MDKKIIHKSAGIIIKDKKLLVVESKNIPNYYIAPGGKFLKNESPKNTLIRELQEELDIKIYQNDLSFFGDYSAIASGTDDQTVKMKVFLVRKWIGDIKPTNEVINIEWIDSTNRNKLQISSIFAQKKTLTNMR